MKKLCIEHLLHYKQKPEPFTKGEPQFWQDPHIAKGMLKAHLDQNTSAASYKIDTIKKIVDFISNKVNLKVGDSLLDCGCGPGLYCELFSKKRLKVTGVDISMNSINYAKQSAKKQNLNIIYDCQDYLSLNYNNKFDVVVIIWHDFCVLNNNERNIFLKNVHKALKPNGYFVFDVSTPNIDKGKKDSSSWQAYKSGFWSAEPHVVLNNFFYYNNNKVQLKQHVVIEENRERIFRIYLQHYWPQELRHILNENRFTINSYYQDLMGNPYTEDSATLAIIAQKIM